MALWSSSKRSVTRKLAQFALLVHSNEYLLLNGDHKLELSAPADQPSVLAFTGKMLAGVCEACLRCLL